MKRKLFTILTGFFIVISLSGCNVKFIEKVEPETTESSTENFGNIIIENSKEEPTENISTENSYEELETTISEQEELETSENIQNAIESSENLESSENSQSQDIGTFEYSGVTFISLDATPTMYCKENCSAKISPSVAAKDYATLQKGDFVTVKALSEDNRWAMVFVYGGPASFIKYEYLTEEEVRIEQTLSELPVTTENESTTESSETKSTTQSQEQSSSSQTIEKTSSSQQYTEPVDTYSGIPYPSNPSSTSINLGVEFADVNTILTVRKDGTQISDGPDKVANSTGYYSIGTLNKGDTITCTGIGRNGYVRVEYNGQRGFINSKNVE